GGSMLRQIGTGARQQKKKLISGPDYQELIDKVVPNSRRSATPQAQLDYREGRPVLAVKLQELFGTAAHPSVMQGRLPVRLELLSPAGRPAAVSEDLPHFWRHTYAEVRRELRGRYPKHPWPEDPTTAVATAGTKRHQQQQRS
ncbi:MAG: ATP-dependent helicase C-terminal domain-containing protein, partial [Prochlorococcaceae cyanobacterium]